MKRGGDSTHPCQNPTSTVNGCDLTPPTRTKTSEQEHSDMTASYRRPSTPHSEQTPRTFREESGRMLSCASLNLLHFASGITGAMPSDISLDVVIFGLAK